VYRAFEDLDSFQQEINSVFKKGKRNHWF
jgi:hypothetical protein